MSFCVCLYKKISSFFLALWNSKIIQQVKIVKILTCISENLKQYIFNFSSAPSLTRIQGHVLFPLFTATFAQLQEELTFLLTRVCKEKFQGFVSMSYLRVVFIWLDIIRHLGRIQGDCTEVWFIEPSQKNCSDPWLHSSPTDGKEDHLLACYLGVFWNPQEERNLPNLQVITVG